MSWMCLCTYTNNAIQSSYWKRHFEKPKWYYFISFSINWTFTLLKDLVFKGFSSIIIWLSALVQQLETFLLFYVFIFIFSMWACLDVHAYVWVCVCGDKETDRQSCFPLPPCNFSSRWNIFICKHTATTQCMTLTHGVLSKVLSSPATFLCHCLYLRNGIFLL